MPILWTSFIPSILKLLYTVINGLCLILLLFLVGYASLLSYPENHHTLFKALQYVIQNGIVVSLSPSIPKICPADTRLLAYFLEAINYHCISTEVMQEVLCFKVLYHRNHMLRLHVQFSKKSYIKQAQLHVFTALLASIGIEFLSKKVHCLLRFISAWIEKTLISLI